MNRLAEIRGSEMFICLLQESAHAMIWSLAGASGERHSDEVRSPLCLLERLLIFDHLHKILERLHAVGVLNVVGLDTAAASSTRRSPITLRQSTQGLQPAGDSTRKALFAPNWCHHQLEHGRT